MVPFKRLKYYNTNSYHWAQRYLYRLFGDEATSPQVCENLLRNLMTTKRLFSRHGQLEDRDPLRLKDRNGAPVLCFRCGTSALPGSLAAVAVPAAKRARRFSTKAATPEAWKSIISCDYCDLHWHLDCLDPPLPTMPPFTRKWMCPVHAEQVIVRSMCH